MTEVDHWLESLGMGRYAAAFAANDIDLEALAELTDPDLQALGLSLGHRRKLLKAIAALRASAAPSIAPGDAERRQLTILSCDLVGSTALSARLDPEDMREILGAYHRCCAEQITAAGGFVARFMGDGVLAYFGYPQAHEDDAERAARGALALIEAVAQLRVGHEAALQVRVGVATGIVVVGDLIGDGAAQERGVVGDTPNLAARLQTLAEPGQALIAHTTRQLAGGLFEYRDLGRVAVKGLAEPVQAWQVTGTSAVQSRFTARHETILTPLVGREAELDLLLRSWRHAMAGEGRAVLLSGEPGIGKSRLLRMVSEHVAGSQASEFLLQCSSLQTASPLSPVIAELSRAIGIDRRDTAAANLDRIEAWLGAAADGQSVALLADLLAVPPDARCPSLSLAPDRKKALTQDLLIDLLTNRAAERPVLFMLEDAHWIDGTTQELLLRLLDRVHDKRFLAIVTVRPEHGVPWSSLKFATSLVLMRLGRAEIEQLIRGATRGKALPASVVDQIVAKTDGVPLFVEELTKTIVESGQLREEGDAFVLPQLVIPSSLHDSLMARLDRLPRAKEVAQVGSTIGRTFSFAMLAAVTAQPADSLVAELERLVEAGLLVQSGVPPLAEYSFRHALIQDTAYESLLKLKRQALHGEIVRAIEADFPEMAVNEPGLLAHHCERADLVDKEVDYLYAAGLASTRLVAIREAVSYFSKAEAILTRLEASERNVARHIDIILGLMDVGRFTILPKRLHALGMKARTLLHGSGFRDDPTRLSSILFQEGRSLLYTGRYKQARVAFQSLTALGRESASEPIIRKGGSAFAMTLCCQGLFSECLDFINRSTIDYYKRTGSVIDYIAGLGWMGYAQCQSGDGDRGLAHNAISAAEADACRSPIYVAGAEIWRSHALMACRRHQESVAAATRCVEIAQPLSVPYLDWHGLVFLALSQCRSGAFAAAAASLAAARNLLDVAEGAWSLLDYLPAIDAEIACFSGDPTRALSAAAGALAAAAPVDGFFAAALARRVIAVATVRSGGDLADAEAQFERAQALFAAGGANAERAYGSLVWSQALHDAGHVDRARNAATCAVALAAAGGFDLGRCEYGAAQVLQRLGIATGGIPLLA